MDAWLNTEPSDTWEQGPRTSNSFVSMQAERKNIHILPRLPAAPYYLTNDLFVLHGRSGSIGLDEVAVHLERSMIGIKIII